MDCTMVFFYNIFPHQEKMNDSFYKRTCGYFFITILLFPFALLSCGAHNDQAPNAPQKVAVIGTGYVGLVLGAGLAEMGNVVTCVDIMKEKIEYLQKGGIPIYEPGLREVVEANLRAKRLQFSYDIDQSIRENDVIFIAVGTPTGVDGEADISAVETAAATIGKNLNQYKVVCVKSTVPIGVTHKVRDIIAFNKINDHPFDVAFNPEFLREGSAITDFFYPDRIVIGVESEKAQKVMEQIYLPFIQQNIPLLKTNIPTAEAIKYASNSFLAVKISYINEFANLCEATGADILDVAAGMGLDKRIGRGFLNPGPGYGGSCFPKDTLALLHTAKNHGIDLKITRAAVDANDRQKKWMVQKICHFLGEDLNGKTIAVLGLSFKAHTDDVRCSPAIDIIKEIEEKGGHVKAYDPMAMDNMQKIYPDIEYCKSLFAAVKDCEAVIVLTEWKEFKEMDLKIVQAFMKRAVLIDTRNLFNPKELQSLGFQYDAVGRLKH
jgi:UDPglucose 6-dehydrogenase